MPIPLIAETERLRVSRFLRFLGDDWDDAGASAARQASVTDRERVSCGVSTTRRRTHRHCPQGARHAAPRRLCLSVASPQSPHPGAPARLRVGTTSGSDDGAASGCMLRLNDYISERAHAGGTPAHPVCTWFTHLIRTLWRLTRSEHIRTSLDMGSCVDI